MHAMVRSGKSSWDTDWVENPGGERRQCRYLAGVYPLLSYCNYSKLFCNSENPAVVTSAGQRRDCAQCSCSTRIVIRAKHLDLYVLPEALHSAAIRGDVQVASRLDLSRATFARIHRLSIASVRSPVSDRRVTGSNPVKLIRCWLCARRQGRYVQYPWDSKRELTSHRYGPWLSTELTADLWALCLKSPHRLLRCSIVCTLAMTRKTVSSTIGSSWLSIWARRPMSTK